MKQSVVILEANIVYRGGSACYQIIQEREGIFSAHLLSQESIDASLPPSDLTLVKGIRNWTGSVEDASLLHELGKVIDGNRQKLEK